MSTQMLADRLFQELLFYALLLLIILFVINIVTYKRKLRDFISLMLVSGIFMCAFDTLWDLCDGKPGLRALSYTGACGYAIAYLAFIMYLNRFMNDQFGWEFEKKWLRRALYYVPFGVFVLLCVTTPWTRLIFEVDASGVVQEMLLFETLFYVLAWGYAIASLVPAVYYLIPGRKKNPTAHRNARYMVVFVVIVMVVYVLQRFILEMVDDYYVMSWIPALSLVYLTTVVNTRSLVESQVKVEAVETDLRIAAKIQMDALPPVAPEFADHLELNLRASMDTAREVGGDFYDYFAIDDNRICFLIADVSGKGTPAALFMMTAKTMIKDYALNLESTSEICTEVNARLCENNDEGMFAPPPGSAYWTPGR